MEWPFKRSSILMIILYSLEIKNIFIDGNTVRSVVAAEYKGQMDKESPKDMNDDKTLKTVKMKAFIPSTTFEAVRKSPAFVDKTLFLQEWLLGWSKILYVTAPPLTGKSTLLNMAKTFFEAEYIAASEAMEPIPPKKTSAYKLFANTNIAKHEDFFSKHFKQYSVIYVNFAKLGNATTKDLFESQLCSVMQDTVSAYKYVLKYALLSNTSRKFVLSYTSFDTNYCKTHFTHYFLSFGQDLIRFLHETFHKPTLLLADNYDALLNLHMRENVRESYGITTSFGLFIKGFVKHEGHLVFVGLPPKLKKSLFTGTFSVASMMSPLANNIDFLNYYRDEAVASSYGLSETEVRNLLEKFSLSQHYDEVRDYYCGYSVLNSPLKLFNVASVLRFIDTRELRPSTQQLPLFRAVFPTLKNAFSCREVGSKIAASLFQGCVWIPTTWRLSWEDAAAIRSKAERAVKSRDFEFALTATEMSQVFTILLDLGLYAIKERDGMTETKVLTPASQETREALHYCLKESRYLENTFKIGDDTRRNFAHAVESFEANEKSVDQFGDSVFDLFSKTSYSREIDYQSCLYLEILRLTANDANLYVLDGALEMKQEPSTNYPNVLDILFILRKKSIVLMIAVKLDTEVEKVLDEMVDRRYFDVLETHKKYSEYKNAKHLILIGLSVRTRSCKMTAVSMNYLIDTKNVTGSSVYKREAGSSHAVKTTRKSTVK